MLGLPAFVNTYMLREIKDTGIFIPVHIFSLIEAFEWICKLKIIVKTFSKEIVMKSKNKYLLQIFSNFSKRQISGRAF